MISKKKVNGLKYALLRLSWLGLTEQDRLQLGELARLAYQELDVTQVASQIKSSETAYLFLQHFIKILKAGGKAGIVIKNTFLSNTDNASIDLRLPCPE